MTTQATFSLRGRNPDVLTCIANLSNDEVFTPPDLANRMLDTLAEAWAANNGGEDIWADSTVTFLDPCTKSGVFLREVTTRLIGGLRDQIPDLEERVNHILTKQVFGGLGRSRHPQSPRPPDRDRTRCIRRSARTPPGVSRRTRPPALTFCR